MKFIPLNTKWQPFGGGLLVTSYKEEVEKGGIIIPDTAERETLHGFIQKVSPPSNLYFHPGDEILFHLQGSVELDVPDTDEEHAYMVMPKAVMLHLPVPRQVGKEIV